MGLIHIKERGGNEEYRFKKALRNAKRAIEEIYELSEEMEEEFGERRGSMQGYRHDDYPEVDERRSRDSHGRYM